MLVNRAGLRHIRRVRTIDLSVGPHGRVHDSCRRFRPYPLNRWQPRTRGMSLSPRFAPPVVNGWRLIRQLESHTLNSFDGFGLAEPIARALVARELRHPHPDPGTDRAARPRRPRCHRHRPDRNRQDRRLRPADPASALRQPDAARTQDLPGPGPEPDPGTLQPDSGQLQHLWPPPRPQHRRSPSAACPWASRCAR